MRAERAARSLFPVMSTGVRDGVRARTPVLRSGEAADIPSYLHCRATLEYTL
jgi:hypothetical protein